MPRQSYAKSDRNIPGRKGIKKPRIAANGHRLPDPIPRGEILTDVQKRRWKLGKSIGLGGFGEIYLASDDIRKLPGPNVKYVIKVEPHSNGPLFAEMHFYHRVAKADKKSKRLPEYSQASLNLQPPKDSLSSWGCPAGKSICNDVHKGMSFTE